MAQGNESNHVVHGETVVGGLGLTNPGTSGTAYLTADTSGNLLVNGVAVGTAAQIASDAGLVANSTAYTAGQMVTLKTAQGAAHRKALITSAVTSGSTAFISGSKYLALSPSMPFIHVREFGAVGDGVTDDTAEIQAAIDYSKTLADTTGGGVRIVMDSGYYITSATLVLKRHVFLQGCGMLATVIKLAANSNCDIIKSDDTGGATGNADYFGIVDLGLDGNKANQSGAGPYYAIRLNTNPLYTTAAGDAGFDMHGTIENVRIYRVKGTGIYATGRSAHFYKNIYAEQCDNYSFEPSFDTIMVGCLSSAAGWSGFHLCHGSQVLVGCKSYINGSAASATGKQAGFFIDSAIGTEITLSGCDAQQNYGQGYLVDGSTAGVCIIGCTSGDNNYPAKTADTNPTLELANTTSYVKALIVSDQDPVLLRITGTSTNCDINISGSGSSATTLCTTDTVITGTNQSIVLNNSQLTPTTFAGMNVAQDTNLYRSAANILATDDDFAIKTAGKGLRVAEGSNAKMGTAVLSGGTLVVSTTAVTASSRIFLTCNVPGGTPGWLQVSARTAATSFTILSSSGTDTSTVGWMIVEPA